MKVYVSRRDPRKAGDLPGREVRLIPTPSFTMQKTTAELLSYWLNVDDDHGKAGHRCAFEVEQVGPGQFVLVCADHPESAQ